MARRLMFYSALFIFVGSIRAATPTLPSINTNNVINITNAPYNAVGDGSTDNAAAIQAAIKAAGLGPATNGLSGGTVRIPVSGVGVFVSGPIVLTNNVNLQIDPGATLEMLPVASYPGGSSPPDFITANNLHDVEISGSGTINGQADFSGWWDGRSTSARPYMIMINKCQRVLIQNVLLENAAKMHIAFKGSDGNVTIQGITINTPGNSPNTDGIDLIGTNCLVQNCSISDGDDNIALGSSSSVSSDTLVTNCTFGTGHGVSIGSNTQGGVSNLDVVNCSFNGTVYGIRMKSDTNSSGGSGQGGVAQNLTYANITMTNILDAAIVIYSYYEEFGTPTSITPQTAASQPVPGFVTNTTCVWRNITISNVTASVASTGIAGIIWGRTELPATNITFDDVNITAPKSFDLYNAGGVAFIDSQITLPAGNSAFTLFNAGLTITNSAPASNLVTLDGLATNALGNTLLFYNTQASLINTNAISDGPLTLGASTLTVSNSLALSNPDVLNFVLGTSAAKVAVAGNLTLGGTVNVTNGPGFAAGAYTLLTYTGSLQGTLPSLGTTPAGFTYSFDTSTAGQVKLDVLSGLQPAVPTNLTATATNLGVNLTWGPSANATSYNLKRSTTNGGSGGSYPFLVNVTATNYSDTLVTNGVTYYYVVSATNSAGESVNSAQASAAPLPSIAPVHITLITGGGQMQLNWPQDHLGWHLQVQTNYNPSGIGSSWTTWSGSSTTNQVFVPIVPTNGSVFLRLTYP
jgi:polygalacturonase